MHSISKFSSVSKLARVLLGGCCALQQHQILFLESGICFCLKPTLKYIKICKISLGIKNVFRIQLIRHSFKSTMNLVLNESQKRILPALLCAFVYDRPEPTNFLLRCNASVNAVDKVNRNSPLHCAVLAGNIDSAHILLDSGASVELQNNSVRNNYDPN